MIPLAKPCLGKPEVKSAGEVILSGWLTQGPKVKEFEKAFASYVGSSYACAAANCTAALHMALLTVGVNPGDIVITVSYSFIGTANSVRLCGAEPVFVDIDAKTYNMSPEALQTFLTEECVFKGEELYYKNVEKLIGGTSPFVYLERAKVGRVAAVMPVHQLGMPCDMDAVLNIARKYRLPVVEDAACALGSEIRRGKRWERIGRPHGDIACFSFHPRKILTTGDGGMLTTNNAAYDRSFRLLRNHGMNISGAERKKANKVIVEKYLMTAFNYRMTDVQAAIGLAQLDRLPGFIVQRRRIDGFYHKYLKDISWLELPFEPAYARSNWQSYSIKILDHAPCPRDEIIQYLFQGGVCCIPGIRNAYTECPYAHVPYHLPMSDQAQASVIIFPFYVGLKESDVRRMGRLLRALK